MSHRPNALDALIPRAPVRRSRFEPLRSMAREFWRKRSLDRGHGNAPTAAVIAPAIALGVSALALPLLTSKSIRSM